jgi:hypothetical protein
MDVLDRSAACRADERASTDGEGVWSWPPDAEVKSREMIARRRGQESPVSGESAL